MFIIWQNHKIHKSSDDVSRMTTLHRRMHCDQNKHVDFSEISGNLTHLQTNSVEGNRYICLKNQMSFKHFQMEITRTQKNFIVCKVYKP